MKAFYQQDRRDGTGQADRFPAALRSGYFCIDELSHAELLGLSQSLAENLLYVDLDNQSDADSTWADLFSGDPVFVLADIINTDTKKIERSYRAPAVKLSERLAMVCQLHASIGRWYRALRSTAQPQLVALTAALGQFIHNSLDQRQENLINLFERTSRSSRQALLAKMHSGSEENVPTPTQYLQESFHQFVGAINYFKTMVVDDLDPDHAHADQNPAVSLYVTFLKLYARAQKTLNGFPEKRLDFYYKRLLGVRPRPSVPDSVNLALTLAPGQPAVTIPKGTAFFAGKDVDEQDVLFLSDDELHLSDAVVGDIRTFHLNRHPLISPQNDLGCVTSATAASINTSVAAESGVPLFGAGAGPRRDAACLGLAIASPLLLLAEGERRITLDITCHNPAHKEGYGELPLPECPDAAAAMLAGTAAEYLSGPAGRTAQRDRFARRVGQVLAREVIASAPWLSVAARASIVKSAAAVLGESNTVADLLAMDRAALFYRFLRDGLDLRLTTADGWLARNNYVIRPLPNTGEGSVAGLRLELMLAPDEPPITPYRQDVHGEQLPTEQAVLSLRVNSQSLFYSYSLLAALDIENIELAVAVRGARRLSLYSQLGQLDPSRPFVPFGPQPGRESYLAIGHQEAARKPLTKACARLQWGVLPATAGGFEEHYRGYSGNFNTDLFRTRASVLGHSGWVANKADEQPLFARAPGTGQLCDEIELDLLQGQYFEPLDGQQDEDFRLDNLTRGGFFRLDLSPCDQGFGHAQYAGLLADVLVANAKRRKPLRVPRLPYTPMINTLVLDYSARENIRLRNDASVAQPHCSSVFHQHPFGVKEVARNGRNRPLALMPQYLHDGYLLIGLVASEAPERVSLLFDLVGGERKVDDDPLELYWSYLRGNELRPLPTEAVLRDTTASFARSGVVTLALPADIDTTSTALPDGFFWIAVAARGNLHLSPRLRQLRTGGLCAVRERSATTPDAFTLAADTILESRPALASIGRVEQPAASYGGRPQEDRTRLITRTAERLHHKGRACQPWDYERLVLEHFPNIFKVKCFANMRTDRSEPCPGHVLIVVVPTVEVGEEHDAQQFLVNPERLREIRAFLSSRTSAFASITVRNAAYELIQIRCSVKFVERADAGRKMRELQRRISRYISPWRPGGYGARFGWQIKRKDIESCIGMSEHVEFVTDFSMLHITQKTEREFCLVDTARGGHAHDTTQEQPDDVAAGSENQQRQIEEIRPLYPWSLALPSRQHFIRPVQDLTYIPPEPTGVGELEVGSTLILDSGHGRG